MTRGDDALPKVWLYKMGAAEAAQTWEQTTEIFRRDVFSFWSPLDARFLALVAKFVRDYGIAYVAPFWTTFFWRNVDYSATTKDLAYPQLTQQANRAVLQALQQATFTPLGRAWAAAIRD